MSNIDDKYNARTAVSVRIELVSPVNPRYVSAFSNAIKEAIAPINAQGHLLRAPSKQFLAKTKPRPSMFVYYHSKLAHMYEKRNLINEAVKEYRLAYTPTDEYYIAYCWKLDFGSDDLSLSEQRVRDVLSAVKVCRVDSVKLKPVWIPPELRPYKHEQHLSACQCTEFPCEHIPGIPWEEQVRLWQQEDHRSAVRRAYYKAKVEQPTPNRAFSLPRSRRK
jgi:hypothetical protein